jgi:hypothetical protein
MILNVHVPGAACYEIGEEIWQHPLAEAIRVEAETIADYAGPELLPSPSQAQRAALRDRIATEMTPLLTQVGDVYTAPDGVVYSLTDEPALDPSLSEGTLSPLSDPMPSPVVQEVLRFEDLPLGSAATRRAIARWSDGTESVALSWYGDEILICEGDLLGKTREQLRSLHFRRGRDWLQS